MTGIDYGTYDEGYEESVWESLTPFMILFVFGILYVLSPIVVVAFATGFFGMLILTG